MPRARFRYVRQSRSAAHSATTVPVKASRMPAVRRSRSHRLRRVENLRFSPGRPAAVPAAIADICQVDPKHRPQAGLGREPPVCSLGRNAADRTLTAGRRFGAVDPYRTLAPVQKSGISLAPAGNRIQEQADEQDPDHRLDCHQSPRRSRHCNDVTEANGRDDDHAKIQHSPKLPLNDVGSPPYPSR
jgi:hypothetical protein